MIRLTKTLKAWSTPDFEDVVKQELEQLDRHLLPLQAGLSQSSYVGDEAMKVIVINSGETPEKLTIKAGIFYSGIIAGSCCADDPTPPDQQTEYCEIMVELYKATAEANITLTES